MGKRDELNEQAMLAMSLRRQNMTVAKIALYLGVDERKTYLLLARARKLWGLLVDASDSKTRIGEALSVFEFLERKALENLARVNPNSNVAIGYLNAALSAREKIKKLQQESGLMVKVAEEVKITGLPIQRPEIMSLALELIKVSREPSEKNEGNNGQP